MTKIGYYSQQSRDTQSRWPVQNFVYTSTGHRREIALSSHVAVYARADGSEVEVTEVVDEGVAPLSRWPDLVCIGPVESFVRLAHFVSDTSGRCIAPSVERLNDNESIK